MASKILSLIFFVLAITFVYAKPAPQLVAAPYTTGAYYGNYLSSPYVASAGYVASPYLASPYVASPYYSDYTYVL
uniref:CSON000668 protein n=1 Tax=Culicoides sonorensis TaxID=179676 RepID=A0A336MG59_CULSO